LQIRNKEQSIKRTLKVFNQRGPNSNHQKREKSILKQGQESPTRAIEAGHSSIDQKAPLGLHPPRLVALIPT